MPPKRRVTTPMAAAPAADAATASSLSVGAPHPSTGSGLLERAAMYALLASHQMANYITRLAVPFIVPYMVAEFGFSESQRALLLNSFSDHASTHPPQLVFPGRF